MLAIASTLALAAVLLLVIQGWQAAGAIAPADYFSGWSKGQPRDPLALAAIACNVFVCGLLCSLLLKRPLIAACIGAGMAVLVSYLGTLITNLLAEEPVDDRTPGDYGWIWSATVFSLSAGVFLIDIAVGQRWLEWGTLRIKRGRTISSTAEEHAAVATKRRSHGPDLARRLRPAGVARTAANVADDGDLFRDCHAADRLDAHARWCPGYQCEFRR